MIKSKKYYIIIAIIAGVGLFLILIGGVMGGLKVHSELFGDIQKTYNTENPKSLSVRLDMGELTINKTQSGSGKIEVVGRDVAETNLRMTETPMGDCQIEYLQSRDQRFALMSFGKYNFTAKGIYEYESPTLTISVPESVKRLTVITNMGDVKVYDISADFVQLELNLGDLHMQNINSKAVEIEVNAGSTSMNGVIADLFEIESDLGDVKVQNAEIKNLDVSINAGDVEFGGTVTGRGEIESDLGEVRIDFADDLQKYAFNVDVSFGELEIAGQKFGTPYRQAGFGGMNSGMSSGLIPFVIESDAGDVTID
jgi:hypothetical protein